MSATIRNQSYQRATKILSALGNEHPSVNQKKGVMVMTPKDHVDTWTPLGQVLVVDQGEMPERVARVQLDFQPSNNTPPKGKLKIVSHQIPSKY